MEIIDITKNLFEAEVFKGDTVPTVNKRTDTKKGDDYTVSDIIMCVHNGTHIDAPNHVLTDGITVEKLNLNKCIGECLVTDTKNLIDKLKRNRKISNKILIKEGQIDADLAEKLIEKNVELLGVEGLSIGDKTTHQILLMQNVIVLENLQLSHVKKGSYFLIALPAKFDYLEAAPVRALLIKNGRIIQKKQALKND